MAADSLPGSPLGGLEIPFGKRQPAASPCGGHAWPAAGGEAGSVAPGQGRSAGRGFLLPHLRSRLGEAAGGGSAGRRQRLPFPARVAWLGKEKCKRIRRPPLQRPWPCPCALGCRFGGDFAPPCLGEAALLPPPPLQAGCCAGVN